MMDGRSTSQKSRKNAASRPPAQRKSMYPADVHSYRLSLTTCRTKRYSRWKTKVQAELAKGPPADAEGNGDAEAADGSESSNKAVKSTPKKAKAEGTETPKKKTPAKKATSAKKRKIDEAEEGEEVKDEPEDRVSLSDSEPAW